MKQLLIILFGLLILGIFVTFVWSIWAESIIAFKAFITLFTIYWCIKIVEWELK